MLEKNDVLAFGAALAAVLFCSTALAQARDAGAPSAMSHAVASDSAGRAPYARIILAGALPGAGNVTADARAGMRRVPCPELRFSSGALQGRGGGRPQRSALRSVARWASVAVAAAAGGLAYRFEQDARSAYDERNRAYERYRGAYTSVDVAHWREIHDDAGKRGDSAARKRDICWGVAGAGLSVGVSLWVWR